MARPNRFTAEEENQLKFEFLFTIKEWECKTASEIANCHDSKLTPQQIQYYLNKWQFNFEPPHTNNETLTAYEEWCWLMEMNGAWIGPKTILQAIINREAMIKPTDEVISSPDPPVLGKVYSYKAMIEAAKTNHDIALVSDWERIA